MSMSASNILSALYEAQHQLDIVTDEHGEGKLLTNEAGYPDAMDAFQSIENAIQQFKGEYF